MRCERCGSESAEEVRFCRSCGTQLAGDPDELVAAGISKVITGDGFLTVAVFLSVTQTAMSSLLWLLLLLPAFYLFGQGFSDVFRAAQIRRKRRRAEIERSPSHAELPPPQVSVVDIVTNATTGKLVVRPGRSRET